MITCSGVPTTQSGLNYSYFSRSKLIMSCGQVAGRKVNLPLSPHVKFLR